MEIKLNGRNRSVTAVTAEELCTKSDLAHSYIIINGYSAVPATRLNAGDEVFIIPKNTCPHRDEWAQMLYARHTPGVQAKLNQAVVAISGLGGLGSNIAVQLCRCGIGTLRLFDFDTVDISNLNRQSYFIEDLGRLKTEALAEQLRRINPYVTVYAETVRLTGKNAGALLRDCNIVIEAFDDPRAKAMLVNTVLEELPETVIIAASGMAGYGRSNAITTRKINDHFYLCGDATSAAKPDQGLMAPRVALCAAHEANLAVELLAERL